MEYPVRGYSGICSVGPTAGIPKRSDEESHRIREIEVPGPSSSCEALFEPHAYGVELVWKHLSEREVAMLDRALL